MFSNIINNPYVKLLKKSARKIISSVNNINLCRYCMTDMSDMPDEIYMTDMSDDIPDEIYMTDMTDQTTDYTKDRKISFPDVRIRLVYDIYMYIDEITIKYPTDTKYIKVPFEEYGNPDYIQDILDIYTDIINDKDLYVVVYQLFTDLSKISKGTKYDYPPSWFEGKVEWVKFSYSHQHGGMIPTDFDLFKSEQY